MLQRDLLMQAVAPRGGRELLSGGYDSETLQTLSGAFTPAQLLANLQSIQDALTAMAAQPNPRIAAELCLIRLCRPELCLSLIHISWKMRLPRSRTRRA